MRLVIACLLDAGSLSGGRGIGNLIFRCGRGRAAGERILRQSSRRGRLSSGGALLLAVGAAGIFDPNRANDARPKDEREHPQP
jgi:hypothetical protein